MTDTIFLCFKAVSLSTEVAHLASQALVLQAGDQGSNPGRKKTQGYKADSSTAIRSALSVIFTGTLR